MKEQIVISLEHIVSSNKIFKWHKHESKENYKDYIK